MPHVIIRFRLPEDQGDFDAAMQGRDASTQRREELAGARRTPNEAGEVVSAQQGALN